jgi:hypothetical protein
MKTTLEIPDPIFRRVKAVATERGIPVQQLLNNVLEDKFRPTLATRQRKLLKLAGGLRHLKGERARMNTIVEREFEQVDPEMWK